MAGSARSTDPVCAQLRLDLKRMKLYQLYSPLTVVATDHEPLSAVAARMRFNDVGSVPVLDDHDVLVGILTERDIVRAVADGVDIEKTEAHEYMTSNPTLASPDMEVREAARLMLEKGIRHLPVVASNGSLIGLASVRDLVQELVGGPPAF